MHLAGASSIRSLLVCRMYNKYSGEVSVLCGRVSKAFSTFAQILDFAQIPSNSLCEVLQADTIR